VLRSLDVDGVLHLAAQGRIGAIPMPPTATLGAACEFACALEAWHRTGQRDLETEGMALVAACPPLALALNALRRPANEAPCNEFGAPELEFWNIRSADDVCDTASALYLDRFRRSLDRAGFHTRVAHALSKALAEMADNIVAHSLAPGGALHGLIAYHVDTGWMSFAAADIGCGVLASLRSSSEWSALSTAEQALDAAVRTGASRRIGEGPGTGFGTVHRSIASLNGVLRFRSDDAQLTLDGSAGSLRARGRRVARLGGLQVTVTASLGRYAEHALPIALDRTI